MARISWSAFLTLLGAALSSSETPSTANVHLTVAYCPTYFSGRGAVVRVNPDDAAAGTTPFTVVDTFEWSDDISNFCPVEEDTTFVVDPYAHPGADVLHNGTSFEAAGRSAHLSFTSNWGEVAVVDLDKAILAHDAEGSWMGPHLFDGFTTFGVAGVPGEPVTSLKGITPTVTGFGFCTNGCFQFGRQDLATGEFLGYGQLPFKAAMTNVGITVDGVFFVQGSYPLTDAARCDGSDSSQCFFAINASTGRLLSSNSPASVGEVVVYRYSAPFQNGTVLAWVHGFTNQGCTSYAFAFATFDSRTGPAFEFISCIPRDITVHTTPDMSAFTQDGTRFATASGNAYTGVLQLLVFDVNTGEVVLDSDLDGLERALHMTDEAPFIQVWATAFLDPMTNARVA